MGDLAKTEEAMPIQCLLVFGATGGHAEVSRRPASDRASDAPIRCLLEFGAIGGRGRLGIIISLKGSEGASGAREPRLNLGDEGPEF